MTQYLYTFFAILFFLPLTGQNLVEKFKSQPGERWYSFEELRSRSKSATTNDFNRNGLDEVMSAIYRDSLFFITFTEFGGQTPTEYRYAISEPEIINNSNKIKFWGSIDLDGKGQAEWLTLLDSLFIMKFSESGSPGQLTLTHVIENPIGFFDVDGDQLADILTYDPDTRQTTVIGVPNTGGLTTAAPRGGSSPTEGDFQVTLKYEQADPAGFRYPENALRDPGDWDFNGDGVIDIVLFRTDSLGNPEGMRVVNGADRQSRLTFRFPDANEDIRKSFTGFFDVDGQNGKEVYLGDHTVLDRNGNLYSLPEHFEPAFFQDVDGDGKPDIVGRDTLKNRVQVLGAASTTSIDPAWLGESGLQLAPAFPNPVRTQATIPFHLEEPQRVQVQMLDLDGRLIETLADGQFPAGDHQVFWRPGSLPAGAYLYRIRVRDGMVARMIVKE